MYTETLYFLKVNNITERKKAISADNGNVAKQYASNFSIIPGSPDKIIPAKAIIGKPKNVNAKKIIYDPFKNDSVESF